MLEERWEKVSRWDRKMQLLFFSVCVDDIKKVRNNEQYSEDVGTSANESRFWKTQDQCLIKFFFVDVFNKHHK